MSISLNNTSKHCLKKILGLFLDRKTVERKPFVHRETWPFHEEANAKKTEVSKIAI